MAARADACEHPDWQARGTLLRLTDVEDGPVTAWTFELEMRCVLCLTPMRWLRVADGDAVAVRLACVPFDVDDAGATP